MATPFRNTIRAIERGRGRPWLVLIGAGAVLAVWFSWFLLAEVPVNQSSVSGRIESDADARSIEAPVAGTVVAHHLHVGKHLAVGDPLLEIDATSLRLELTEAKGTLAALEAEVTVLDRSIESERLLVAELEKGGELAVREAKTSLRGVRANRRLAAQEARRARQMHAQGTSSRAELESAASRSATASANLDAMRIGVDRLRSTNRVQLEEHRVLLSELERQRTVAVGKVEVGRATIERLAHEVERRTVRTPVAGVIGSVGAARVGSVLAEGDVIAVLVPEGRLHVVAMFPASAAGRLTAGQTTVLRFPAYPWTAYGSRHGSVARVAIEPEQKLIRADIDLEVDPTSAIPLEHGMEVIAEVTTERVSPARLLMRYTGGVLDDEAEPAIGPAPGSRPDEAR